MLTTNPIKALNSTHPITLPCGQCIGCRLDRAAQWAMRCHHEAQMHEYNSFITLTYDNEHLPEDYSVNIRTWQLFMKSLRKEVPAILRFFACGEYGEQTLRPHYHALIFGWAFPDREFHSTTTGGHRLFSSKQLSKVWPNGSALIGNVTYQSAGYCARYVMKKITGDASTSHYTRTHPLTGCNVEVAREFATQSRRPGIGSTWFSKYKTDAFPSDFLVVDGRMQPVPRYYSLKLAEEELERVKRTRKRNSIKHKWNTTPERMRVRETIREQRIKNLKETL